MFPLYYMDCDVMNINMCSITHGCVTRPEKVKTILEIVYQYICIISENNDIRPDPYYVFRCIWWCVCVYA